MKVTDEHERRAMALIVAQNPPGSGCAAYRGYLAAVERIEEHGTDSDGVPYYRDTGSVMEAYPSAGVVLDGEGGEYTPAEMRRAAWAWLALADFAEASTTGHNQGVDDAA